jgi:protease II
MLDESILLTAGEYDECLSIDMEAGHSGASARFKKFKDTALEYTFMLYLAGIKKEKEKRKK